MDRSVTTRHNSHRHYNRNYCHHRHHQYHHRYHLYHLHYYHHYHQHIYHCNHQYVNANRFKDKTLRNDNRYRSSFHFSVIFLNTLLYNQDDDDANTAADNDGNADAKYDKYDSDETFLTEDCSRFIVRDTPFASSYV